MGLQEQVAGLKGTIENQAATIRNLDTQVKELQKALQNNIRRLSTRVPIEGTDEEEAADEAVNGDECESPTILTIKLIQMRTRNDELET